MVDIDCCPVQRYCGARLRRRSLHRFIPTMEEGAMADKYQLLEELGSGSFGVVYKAIERASGDIVAIKLVSRQS